MPEQLPVTLGFWLLALVPLAALLVLLVWLRWTAAQAGAVGFFIGSIIAWLAFQSGFEVISVATAKGIWDAIFILYVVWPALLLYEVTEKAGAFDVFRVGIERYTKSRLLLVLAFGWVFASFLQGIAGFGTPIAIVAPLLVGIGVNPVMAVVIPLIGHAWANMFGTLAVGWLATIRVVDLANPTFTAFSAALLLWIPNLLAGLTIAWLYGRWQAVVRALPAVAVVSLVHGGGQLFLSTVNPIISNFIPATLALGVIFAIERLPRYREAEPIESPIFQERGEMAADGGEQEEPKMSIHLAFLPYYALVAVSLIGLLVPPINQFLGRLEIGFPFPQVTTGFGAVTPADPEYGEFAVFTHPGTFLLVATIIGYMVFRFRGFYEKGAERNMLSGMTQNAIPASIAILGFLTLSQIMNHAGMITVLALGIAAVSPAIVYAFLSNFIGVLGAFMTSSNTASNILFAPLQQQTALATPGLDASRIIGAQSAGGAIGNAIAPANVVLGTGTAGIVGQEGEVLKYTLPWSAIAAGLVGLASVILFLLGVQLF
ncbi:MAG: L-lactate permease [Actinobacteria bacterium]|nr:L-lactate permease [Actinomycetota bacterium]